jgi:parallel beta-helix repeat protein
VKLTSFPDSVVRNNNFNRTSTFGTGTGIDIEQSGNTMVSGNSISNQNNGIHIVGSNSKGSTISGNSISQNTNSGILMESAKGVTLTGNTLNSNKNDGIYLSFSDENNLTNNNMKMLGSAFIIPNRTQFQIIMLVLQNTVFFLILAKTTLCKIIKFQATFTE